MNPFGTQQTAQLETMFHRCGIASQDWVDIPSWIVFNTVVPLANPIQQGLKQGIPDEGADFFLRRIHVAGLTSTSGGSPGVPQALMQLKFPNGRYLSSGTNTQSTIANSGALYPGPLGLIKPEVRCPPGSQFTMDFQNVTATFNPPGNDVQITVIFVGVLRYAFRKGC